MTPCDNQIEVQLVVSNNTTTRQP